MESILKALGVLLYGGFINYLVWLFFYWVTPHMVGADSWVAWAIWISSFILWALYSLLASGVSFLFMPIASLVKGSKVVAIACLLVVIGVLLNGYDAVTMPWFFKGDYTTSMYAMAVWMSLFTGFMYLQIVISLSSVALKELTGKED